jgi:hypothetical protein
MGDIEHSMASEQCPTCGCPVTVESGAPEGSEPLPAADPVRHVLPSNSGGPWRRDAIGRPAAHTRPFRPRPSPRRTPSTGRDALDHPPGAVASASPCTGTVCHMVAQDTREGWIMGWKN